MYITFKRYIILLLRDGTTLYQERSKKSEILKHTKTACESTNLLRKINDMKSCKHIQAQIKSEVPDICAFKSNKIGQITSQNVFRSVNHVINTTNAHKSVQRETFQGSQSFVFPTQWKFQPINNRNVRLHSTLSQTPTMAKWLRDTLNRLLQAGERFVLIKAPSTPHNDRRARCYLGLGDV